MKRILSTFLAILLCFSCASGVMAAPSDTVLHFNLTSGDKNEITVPTNTDISVKLYIENFTDEEANFDIQSFSDVIEYDKDFFELDVNSLTFDAAVKTETAVIKQQFSGDIPYIMVNNRYHPNEEFSSKQLVASFTMKVKATSGTEYIEQIDLAAKTSDGNYGEKFTNLKVNVQSSTGGTDGGGGTGGTGGGTTPAKKTYTLTFNDDEFEAITKEEGYVVDLSKYTPQKSGYDFDGWYTEKELTNKVTSVTLTKDIKVYAKWTKQSTGTSSNGGGSVTRYTLSFETNGGSKIDSVSKVRNTTVDLSKYITEKSGYSFDGWYTDKDLKNKVTSVKMTSSMTLYAKWVEGDNGYESNPNYKPDIFAPEHNAYIVGREGGYIAPNENLTRAEAATIFFRLLDGQVLIEGMTKQNNFSDVNEGDWFNTAVSTLTNLGVLTGRTPDTFAPNALITRAEFMTIVARLSEAKYEGEDLFVDIAGHWAKDYINIAASIKWANGYGVIFKPDSNITRAEAFTIVNRATNRLPENTSDLLEGMETFIDNPDVKAWYYINIQEATNSHDFEIKADGVHEKWTSLKENPNWAEIEG